MRRIIAENRTSIPVDESADHASMREWQAQQRAESGMDTGIENDESNVTFRDADWQAVDFLFRIFERDCDNIFIARRAFFSDMTAEQIADEINRNRPRAKFTPESVQKRICRIKERFPHPQFLPR